MDDKSPTSPLETDPAAQLLRDVSRRQKLLGVLHAPLLRASTRSVAGLPRFWRYLGLLPVVVGLIAFFLAKYAREHALFIGAILAMGLLQALYLDLRCRLDALTALLEENGTIGFPKEPHTPG